MRLDRWLLHNMSRSTDYFGWRQRWRQQPVNVFRNPYKVPLLDLYFHCCDLGQIKDVLCKSITDRHAPTIYHPFYCARILAICFIVKDSLGTRRCWTWLNQSKPNKELKQELEPPLLYTGLDSTAARVMMVVAMSVN